VRTIRNVIARLPGVDPDPAVASQIVLLSNHHDAWTYGGVDPSSGTTTALELARALGDLARRGMRPRRTIVFGIWDAEEFTLTGSTEWGEEHADELRAKAVAVPQRRRVHLRRPVQHQRRALPAPLLLRSGEARPRPPGARIRLRRLARGDSSNIRGYGVVAGESTAEPRVAILGQRQRLHRLLQPPGRALRRLPVRRTVRRVPLDLRLARMDAPPGRSRASTTTRPWPSLWGVAALRLANADVLPLDYSAYGRDLAVYLDEVEALARQGRIAVGPRSGAPSGATTGRARVALDGRRCG
jgi:N-acetylated-alpha-linked acidic dipeptidase